MTIDPTIIQVQSLKESLQEAQEQLKHAREYGEQMAVHLIQDVGADIEGICPGWIEVPEFCVKHNLELPEDWKEEEEEQLDADKSSAEEHISGLLQEIESSK